MAEKQVKRVLNRRVDDRHFKNNSSGSKSRASLLKKVNTGGQFPTKTSGQVTEFEFLAGFYMLAPILVILLIAFTQFIGFVILIICFIIILIVTKKKYSLIVSISFIFCSVLLGLATLYSATNSNNSIYTNFTIPLYIALGATSFVLYIEYVIKDLNEFYKLKGPIAILKWNESIKDYLFSKYFRKKGR